MKKRLFTLAAGLALACGGVAQASVDTSPQPGGVYRLKPGIYVAHDTGCAEPPNAAIRLYDGKGIGTAHTSACKATVRKRRGNSYTADQSCIDAGSGPGPRFVQRQQVVVRDALTFTQVIGKSRTTYHYCPVSELPPGLRNVL